MSLRKSIENLKAAIRNANNTPGVACPPNVECYKSLSTANGTLCMRYITTYDPARGCAESAWTEKVMNGECPDVYKACN